MRLFLDSSYLIPALNIEITEGWSKQDLLSLIHSEKFNLYYWDLSLFEIFTKAIKLVLKGDLSVEVEKIQRGLQAILNSKKLHNTHWWEHLFELDVILKLKQIHNDSIDCMIFYMSVVLCDCFATFDNSLISKIKDDQAILNWIREINPNFQVWMNDLKSDKENIL